MSTCLRFIVDMKVYIFHNETYNRGSLHFLALGGKSHAIFAQLILVCEAINDA